MSAGRQGGFTLMEVLVALTVIAVALAALISETGRAARGAGDMKLKTYANWVAANQLAEIRLQPGWADTGRRSGEVVMGQPDRRWYWWAEISSTQDNDLRRIDVYVSHLEDRREGSLVLLTGYEARPTANPGASSAESATP
ncbi:MAG: type II secretion system minor pseudopilin GspI [Gammaproteobacteria bacterium]|nr:type II secretion system minor pseudopilin GspI [Gammaproteobacteria bacterium]